ncbi:MAG: hypothetical protein ACRCVK_19735 [Aeromonas veronii]
MPRLLVDVHVLDAALAHVVEWAFQKGIEEALGAGGEDRIERTVGRAGR